jgi:hypothetical protein
VLGGRLPRLAEQSSAPVFKEELDAAETAAAGEEEEENDDNKEEEKTSQESSRKASQRQRLHRLRKP